MRRVRRLAAVLLCLVLASPLLAQPLFGQKEKREPLTGVYKGYGILTAPPPSSSAPRLPQWVTARLNAMRLRCPSVP